MQERTNSFGYWLRRRRKALDLTQEALAQRVSCSGFSIRKIEADERRPSRALAERLAETLAIGAAERRDFLDAARAVRSPERLRLDSVPVGAPPDAAAPGAAPPDAPAAAMATLAAPPYVGRRRECDQFAGLIERLAAGAGGVVLVEGEPGIGKSRLLREVANLAQARRLTTLATGCYEIERAMPYQCVIDLVTRALDRLPAAALLDIAPVLLAELAALVPEIGERCLDLPTLSSDFPEARRARLPQAVDQLLQAYRAAGPLVLMVDDIQWADDAGAQVLHYLARQAASRPVLVIYAFRDEAIGADPPFARLVDSLHRETAARRLVLGRLGREDTAELVAAMADATLDASALAGRLHRETEGNPFFLISILQSLNAGETRPQADCDADPGAAAGFLPDALRAAVRVRLAHVPGGLRPVLESAAVLGRRFDFDTLLGVMRVGEEALLDAVEALVRRRLLREDPDDGVYDFSHDKVREVVYRDIGGARRRLLHQAVAEALERQPDGSTLERCIQLAEHFERAQVWSKALRFLLLAGERSLAVFAMRDALHWFDRAVALGESHRQAADEAARLAIYARRGSARAQAGQTQGAVADFRRVLDAARAEGNRALARDTLVQLGMAYRRADAYDEATACLTEALAQSRALGDDPHAADTLYHLGTVAWSNGLNHQAIAFHREAVGLCERAGWSDLVAVQAWHGLGESHYANAEPLAAIDCFARSLELARQRGDKGYESENLMMIGHSCVGTKGLGDYARAARNLEAALHIAQDADLQWHLGPTLLGLDHVRACTGKYGEAWQGIRRTLQWLESLSQTRYQLIAHDYLGQLLLDLGRPDLAMETLERAMAIGRDTRIMFWRGAIEANLAVARAQLGHTRALPELHDTLDRTRRSCERYMMVRCLDALAQVALAQGDGGRCRDYADELLAVADGNGLAELHAVARRWRGEALLLEGACLAAHAELALAADRADRIGRVRLQIDLQDALGRACAALDRLEAAHGHRARAQQMAREVEQSAARAGLQARVSMSVGH